MAQLFEFGFLKLDILKVILDKLIVKCGTYYSWSNQIIFFKSNNDNKLVWLDKQPSNDCIEQIRNVNFTFKVNAYFNVNPTVEFHINNEEETITVDDRSSDIACTSKLENDTTRLENPLQEEQTDEQLNTDPILLQQQNNFFCE